MSAKLNIIQLTGKCAKTNNAPKNKNNNIPQVPKEKKNKMINNLINTATPPQFIAQHPGPNQFAAPNLAQNVIGQSIYQTPQPAPQNAQPAPHPQALGQKKSKRLLKLQFNIEQYADVADQTEQERIAWEMSKTDQLTPLEKYRKLTMINKSIKYKMALLRAKQGVKRSEYLVQKAAAAARWKEEMSKVEQMDSSEEKYQHLQKLKKSLWSKYSILKKTVDPPALEQPAAVTPKTQVNADFTQDIEIVTPIQSLQQQRNQVHSVNRNIIPADFTQDIEIVTPAQSLQQQRNQVHSVNRNIIPADFTQDIEIVTPARSLQQQRNQVHSVNRNIIPADFTQDIEIVTPAQSLQQQRNQVHIVNQNIIPADFTQDIEIVTPAQSLQQQRNQVHSVNRNIIPFQRTTQPKTQDWTEYQNKFKRIGGASPDRDDEGSQEVKQEPNKDQSTNAGPNANLRTQIPPISQQTVTATPQKPAITPKVEQKTTPKSSDIPLKPIGVRVRNPNPGYNHPQPAPHMQNQLSNMGYDKYPKGIPKSFLEENNPVAPLPIPGSIFPAGIPRSFLIQEQQRLQEMTPLKIPTDPAYQTQPAYMDLPSWILPSQPPEPPQINEHLSPNVVPQMLPYAQQNHVETPYSPTDVYSEAQRADDELREGSESPDLLQSNQKRQSAFSRLGPLPQPKKPKLTINLQLSKGQAVREIVDETDESFRYVPVHLRKDILGSEDEIVKKYLPFWPWKKNMQLRKTVSARLSKSVMILEQEQMEAGYEKDNLFIQVVVTGYPKTWMKEDVLDAVLDCVKGKTFIPLFVEFTSQKCRFLVIRCQAALVTIHKVGFCIRKDDVELTLSISLTDTGLNQIDLIPRLVLRRRLMIMSDENQVDLTEFLIEKDVSHFVYFPLNRPTNQMELIQLQSAVTWEHLTELNLSRNRLTSIDGFNLHKNTPRLKRLDLSNNYLDKVTQLLTIRGLPLRSLRLEGNPLCRDYLDPDHYIKVVRMMFPEVMELDGVRITLEGDLPRMKRNYCPEAAAAIVEKFLETFFPLLEASYDDRAAIEDLYDKEAVLTITFKYKLRYGTAFRYFRNLFLRARSLEEGEQDSVLGAASISALICKWPDIEHDRYTISVDVIHHDDFTTILRLGGVLKLTAKSLAEDEHLLTFTRTVVLHSKNGVEYKITNEMLYWDIAREEVTKTAFNVTTVRPKQLSLKLESPPDEELKSKLTDIFVKLADIDKKRGARCLQLKNWDLRSALDYYIMLLKVDDLAPLSSPKDCTPAPQAT